VSEEGVHISASHKEPTNNNYPTDLPHGMTHFSSWDWIIFIRAVD
jgi:hypothetical protein